MTTRQIILIVFAHVFAIKLPGQIPGNHDTLIRRLYSEISSSYDVQSRYIGCYGNLSTLYKKVDTLKQQIGLKLFTEYFNSSSVNLKYYAFIEILALDDEQAFNLLVKEVSRNDSINFRFAGQNVDRARLLDLVTAEYRGFIKIKYYYGGGCTYHARTYMFKKRDRKTWRRKQTTLLRFIEMNGLPQKWIDSYSF